MRIPSGLPFFAAMILYVCFATNTELLTRPQASVPLTFEAATVKPYQPDPAGGRIVQGGACRGVDTKDLTSIPLGRCRFSHRTLLDLILEAFPPAETLVSDSFANSNSTWGTDKAARVRIMPEDQWVTGGPGWTVADFFNIEAEAENPSSSTQNQLRQMLQTLIKERFKLTFHMESKEISGYFLVPARGGAKLQEVSDSPPDPAILAKRKNSGIRLFPMQSGPLSGLASILRIELKAPVIDQTNITGKFDYTALDGVDLEESAALDSAASSGSIFSALQEKLGLKLEAHKIPVQIFIIDHAEKPSDSGWSR